VFSSEPGGQAEWLSTVAVTRLELGGTGASGGGAACGTGFNRRELRATWAKTGMEPLSSVSTARPTGRLNPVAALWMIRSGGASLRELMHGISLDAISLEAFVASAARAEALPPLVAMEYFSGDVFDVDLLGVHGTLRTAVPRRRFHPRTTPFRGCRIERHPAVLALAREVHQALALDFLHDVDIMLDARGKAHLLEINPRQSASVITTVAAGLNLLEHVVRRALDLDIPSVPVPYGVAVRPSVRTTCIRRNGHTDRA